MSTLDRASERRLRRLRSVADARRAARRVLPPMVFDFIDGGAEDEHSVTGNEAAFDGWWFRPRPLEDVSTRDQQISLFGRAQSSPLVLAPAGLAGLAWPKGEAVAAAAAAERGLPFALSSMASSSVEEVRGSAGEGAPLWIQLYLWRDRAATERLVHRAADAGYGVLCLTVDVPLSGRRERDVRNGMTIPPRIGVRNSLGVLSRPGWALRSARNPVTFANVAGSVAGGTMALGAYVDGQLNPAASWRDLAWLRQIWPGTLVVKGVLHPGAARRLLDEGADGLVVSNHGGRQLDGAVPSLQALPEVVAAVEGRVPVLLDGGVRRGSDVVKAVALGASACLIGRPYLWGLALGGGPGVRRVLDLLVAEIDRTLALLGTQDLEKVAALGPDLLVPASAPAAVLDSGRLK